MQLYIMRHGEAQHVIKSTGMNDSQRPLTKQGVFEAEIMGRWLASITGTLNTIFVSPYLRAQQTCTTLVETREKHLHSKSAEKSLIKPITLDCITPSSDAKQVHDYLDGFLLAQDKKSQLETEIQQQAVLIVSHMPLVSYLVAELTKSSYAPIFATAAIIQIDYDIHKMQGQFVRLVSPLDFC